MKFPNITKKFLENEIYKLCAGEDVQHILGKYSQRSTYQPQDLIKVCIQACLEQTSPEDICSTQEGPSADRLHDRMSEHSLTQIESLVNGWLTEVTSRQQFHSNTKITIAFDLYQQPYYGDPSPEWITGMDRKKGASYAISFLIVSIATGTKRCPIAVRLISKTLMKQKACLIDTILADLRLWLPVKRVLLDRGFCEDEIIQVLEMRSSEFIIAAIRHWDIKTAAQEIKTCVEQLASQAGVDVTDNLALGQWVRKQGLDSFRVKNVSTGKKKTPVELVAVMVRQRTHNRDPLKRWTYNWFLYLTNCQLSPREIVRLYGKRWIIETDIRCISEFKAITNSTSPQLRLLLYGLAMVFDALWMVFSLLLNRFRSNSSFSITEETRFCVKQVDPILIIARAFKRLLRTEILPTLSFRGGDA